MSIMPFNLFTICGVIYLVLIFVVFLLDVSLPCIDICSVIYLILIFTVSVLSLCLIQYLSSETAVFITKHFETQ